MQTHTAAAQRALAMLEPHRALLATDAMRADKAGRISDDVLMALTDAGCFRLAADPAIGGDGLGALPITELAVALGTVHPAAAWNIVVSNSHAATSQAFASPAALPDGTRDADLMYCGSYGSANAILDGSAGGLRLSGSWGPASHARHADWATLDADHPEWGRVFVLVPMTELTVQHTWQVIGMRGTGSETVIADGVPLDPARVLRMAEFEKSGGDTNLSLRIPKPMRTSLGLAAVGLGAATGFAHEVVTGRRAGTTATAGLLPAPLQAETPAFSTAFAQAATRLQSARRSLHALSERVDAAARDGIARDPEPVTGFRLDLSRIVRDGTDALHELSLIAGSATAHEGTRVGMLWRDAHVALRHGALSSHRGFEISAASCIDDHAKAPWPRP